MTWTPKCLEVGVYAAYRHRVSLHTSALQAYMMMMMLHNTLRSVDAQEMEEQNHNRFEMRYETEKKNRKTAASDVARSADVRSQNVRCEGARSEDAKM